MYPVKVELQALMDEARETHFNVLLLVPAHGHLSGSAEVQVAAEQAFPAKLRSDGEAATGNQSAHLHAYSAAEITEVAQEREITHPVQSTLYVRRLFGLQLTCLFGALCQHLLDARCRWFGLYAGGRCENQ
jgi:hypothetical protein